MTRARPFLRAALCAAAFALAGCVQTDDDVTVKADGSGSFTETTVLDLAAVAAIQEEMKALPDFGRGPGMDGGEKPPAPPTPPPGDPGAGPAPEAPKPPTDPVERMKARWKDVPGLEVTNATTETKEGKAHVRLEAKFQTLEAYAQATNIEMGASLVKNEDGSYTLKFELRGPGRGGRGGERRDGPGMGEGQPGGMDEGGMEGGTPGMDGGDAPRGPGPGGPGGTGGMGGMGGPMAPLFEKHMAGLEFTRKLKLPGPIVETNGTKGEDGSVSWKLTYEEIKAGKVEPQSVTFQGEGLDLKPFTVKRSARRTFGLGGPGGPGGRGGRGGPGGPGAPGAPGAPPGAPGAPGEPAKPEGEGK